MNNLYAGTIGGDLNIRLFLARQGEALNGFYYYDKSGHYDLATNRTTYPRLQLEGKVEGNGQFMLAESDQGKAGDNRLGHFRGIFDAQGQAKGIWENATGERKLPFHFKPTDSLEQGKKPRYRLRFVSIADEYYNTRQIWLTIEGKKETVLTESDNEAASACYADAGSGYDFSQPALEPDSISVLLLQGQPNLHWIQYEIHQESGSSTTINQRHRAGRADDPGKIVFDEWALETFGMHQGWGYSWKENYTLTYQGSTLSVKKESWKKTDANGDVCGDCAYVCKHCSEHCELWCGRTDPCHGKCISQCQRDGCYDECLGKINLKYSTRKRWRTIDVGVGHVISDKTILAEEFLPMRYLCKVDDDKKHGVTPRSFLLLDDGISGWLVIRDNQITDDDSPFGPRAEHPVPDPEEPDQIHAITACWLYNRAPWNVAYTSQTYPPAPPDQIRPDPFVPKACCDVETTADGKRALIYERTGENSDKRGRLLAMFDFPSGSCYSVNLERSGRWGKALALSANLEEQARTCGSPQTGVGASPVATEPPDQPQRITLGSKVRVRPDPELGCGQLDRLPLGTVVTVLKRTVSPSHVDGAEDRWYQVQTPSGVTGWVFGSLLGPFDRDRPEQTYREIIERHLASGTSSLGEELEFLEFLTRVRPNLPEALAPDFELARLRGIERALAHFTIPAAPPQKVPWLAGMEPYVRPMNDGGPYGLNPGAYWALHDRYRNHPAAERLAWAAVHEHGSGECEDSACAFVTNVSPLARYLRLYPSGANAAEAIQVILRNLDRVDENLKANSMRSCQAAGLGDDPDDRKTFRETLVAAANALREVKDATAGVARKRLEEFLKPCTSASAMKLKGSVH